MIVTIGETVRYRPKPGPGVSRMHRDSAGQLCTVRGFMQGKVMVRFRGGCCQGDLSLLVSLEDLEHPHPGGQRDA